jgi:hypothetical protein
VKNLSFNTAPVVVWVTGLISAINQKNLREDSPLKVSLDQGERNFWVMMPGKKIVLSDRFQFGSATIFVGQLTSKTPIKAAALKAAEFPIKLRSIMMKKALRLSMVSMPHI